MLIENSIAVGFFFFKSEKYAGFVKYRKVNILVLTFPFAVDVCPCSLCSADNLSWQ